MEVIHGTIDQTYAAYWWDDHDSAARLGCPGFDMALAKIIKSGRIQKYKGPLILSLTVVLCLLTIANLLKYGSAAKVAVLENKDFIDVVAKILGATALAIGALASYYRFLDRFTRKFSVPLVSTHSERGVGSTICGKNRIRSKGYME